MIKKTINPRDNRAERRFDDEQKGRGMTKTSRQHKTRCDGARDYWRDLNTLYAGIVAATESRDADERRRLRRRLFYTIHRAIREAHDKGRILRALGDATLKPASLRLRRLLKAYATSKKEGDLYNCLLTADSLARFFIEDHFDPRRARHWIGETQHLAKRFNERVITRDMELLTKKIGPAKKVAQRALRSGV